MVDWQVIQMLFPMIHMTQNTDRPVQSACLFYGSANGVGYMGYIAQQNIFVILLIWPNVY